jgi:transposase
MTDHDQSTALTTWVAIDIAKETHTVLLETPDGTHTAFRFANRRADFDQFVLLLRRQAGQVRIALEPTGDYHRALAYRLVTEGFEVCLISSLASAR